MEVIHHSLIVCRLCLVMVSLANLYVPRWFYD